MTDTFSVKKRSEIMQRIRSASTAPERQVAKIARSVHRYFRINSPRLPGKPDIAYFRLRRAIFVHGCFWHQHRGCSRSNIPKSNRGYWNKKLKDNVARDKRVKRSLREMGWRTLTVWECECRDRDRVKKRISNFLAP